MSDAVSNPVSNTDGSADVAADVPASQSAGKGGVSPRSAQKNPANSANQQAATPPKPPTRYKFGDFEGDENAIKSEIERGRQSNKLLTEADKRLRQASQIEKAKAQRQELAKSNAAKLLMEEYGLSKQEALDQMARFIYEQEVLPQQESPERRAIRERDAKIKEYEDKEAKAKKSEQERQEKVATANAEKKLFEELKTLLDTKKVPPTRNFVRRIAYYMDAYAENGVDIPTERAADLAIQDFRDETGHFLDDSTPEQIMEVLGKERWQKLASKISQWALSQVKARQKAPPPETPLLDRQPAQRGAKRVNPNDMLNKILGSGGVL